MCFVFALQKKPEPTPAPAVTPAPAPEPAPAPAATSNSTGGTSFGAQSAAQMREMLSRKKKPDPRQSNMSLKEKYAVYQNL